MRACKTHDSGSLPSYIQRLARSAYGVPIIADAADRFRTLAFDLNDRFAAFDRQHTFDVATR